MLRVHLCYSGGVGVLELRVCVYNYFCSTEPTYDLAIQAISCYGLFVGLRNLQVVRSTTFVLLRTLLTSN